MSTTILWIRGFVITLPHWVPRVSGECQACQVSMEASCVRLSKQIVGWADGSGDGHGQQSARVALHKNMRLSLPAEERVYGSCSRMKIRPSLQAPSWALHGWEALAFDRQTADRIDLIDARSFFLVSTHSICEA